METKDIGTYIKQLRDTLGPLLTDTEARRVGRSPRDNKPLSQGDFATLIDPPEDAGRRPTVSQADVSRWERMEVTPRHENLAKIARFAQAHGMHNATTEYMEHLIEHEGSIGLIHPRLRRLDSALMAYDDVFVEKFLDVVWSVFYLMTSTYIRD